MRLTSQDKVNLIATYHFFVGGIYLIAAIAIILLPVLAVLLQESDFFSRLPGWLLGSALLAVGGFVLLVALVNLALGWGLWQFRPWGRLGAMLAAIFRIPAVPIGTVAGGVILYLLLQDNVRALFEAEV